MCGLVGVLLPKVTESDLLLVKRLFFESRIRGKHATGLSYVHTHIIYTIKEPVPAEQFIQQHNFNQYLDWDGSLHLIGHCRYSTSDLAYNQPLATDHISIVHNGVVSQEMPENWKQLYGYDCDTKNDSELLLRALEQESCVLTEWQNSSLAVLELRADGSMWAYRNGKRPLYVTKYKDGFIFTSTADIAERAGLTGEHWLLESNVYMLIENYQVRYIDTAVHTLDMQEDYNAV